MAILDSQGLLTGLGLNGWVCSCEENPELKTVYKILESITFSCHVDASLFYHFSFLRRASLYDWGDHTAQCSQDSPDQSCSLGMLLIHSQKCLNLNSNTTTLLKNPLD